MSGASTPPAGISGGIEIALILARAANGVIGRRNGLPWRLAGDMRHFRALTMGKPIIMGRKTYQSIGKPLGGRDNIVISRDEGFAEAGIHVAGDLAGALKIGEEFAHARSARQILVIGGAQIYQLALPFASRIYLTQVHMDARGDVSMAPFAPSEWIEAERRDCAAEPGDSADYSLVTMVRTNRPARDISIAKTLDRPG